MKKRLDDIKTYSTITFQKPVHDIFIENLYSDPNSPCVERQDYISSKKIDRLFMSMTLYQLQATTEQSINRIRIAVVTNLRKKYEK